MNTFKLIRLASYALFIAVIAMTMAFSCQAVEMENEATRESPGTTTGLTEKQQVVDVPGIADIIPLASKLTGRLADLKNRTLSVRNIAVVEKRYAEIETALQGPARILLAVSSFFLNVLSGWETVSNLATGGRKSKVLACAPQLSRQSIRQM